MTTVETSSARASVTREVSFAFTLVRDGETPGDGRSFEGYAAVFNSPTEINDQDGDYTEVISPGAFRRAIRSTNPVLMFNHGKHPLIGDMPLGAITKLEEDARGLYVQARLSDNWLIQPVRDAIRDGAVTGMSFRFEVIKDQWESGEGGRRTRTLKEVRMPELGPVVFPAYTDTTASVRSAFSALEHNMPEAVHVTFGPSSLGATTTFGSTSSNGTLTIGNAATISERDETFSTQDASLAEKVSDCVECLWGITDETSDAYVIEMHDDYALIVIMGTEQAKHSGLWRVGFTTDANGMVMIQTPTLFDTSTAAQAIADPPAPMEPAYMAPKGGMNSNDLGTSDELAAQRSTSNEPAAPRTMRDVPTHEQMMRTIQMEARGICIAS